MKLIFIVLLVLNFAYFCVNYYSNAPAEAISIERGDVIPSVRLLSENTAKRDQEMGLVVRNPVLSNETTEKNCIALGPFADVFSGQNVIEQLEALSYEVDLVAIDNLIDQSDFRVMIPPANSLQDAFRKLNELKAQEIDSYVITKGEDALGISLGVFSSLDAAQSIQGKLENVGYLADIVDIPRLAREFWVFSNVNPNLQIDDVVRLALQENYEGLELKAQQCQETSD